MTNAALAIMLLADQTRLSGMASHFRKGTVNFTTRDGLILCSVILAIAGGTWVLSRLIYGKEKRVRNSSRGLFRELCQAHQLDGAERRLLVELARCQGLSQPAQLFLAPERFDTPRQAPRLESRRDQIRSLSTKLFGEVDER